MSGLHLRSGSVRSMVTGPGHPLLHLLQVGLDRIVARLVFFAEPEFGQVFFGPDCADRRVDRLIRPGVGGVDLRDLVGIGSDDDGRVWAGACRGRGARRRHLGGACPRALTAGEASFAALDHPQFNGAAAQNQGPMIGEPTRRCALGVLEDVVRTHPQSDFIVPGRGDRVPLRDVDLRRDPLSWSKLKVAFRARIAVAHEHTIVGDCLVLMGDSQEVCV